MNADTGAITIGDALMILEITNLNRITLDDLPAIRMRAIRRWHPDLIQHEKPTQERARRYHANFVRIDAALTLVAYLLSGQSSPRPESSSGSSQASREHVRRCQAELRRIWPDLRNRPGAFKHRATVLSEGITLADALRQDLDDDVAGTAAFSFAAGASIGIVSAFIVAAIGTIMEIVGAAWIMGPIGLFWLALWVAHATACLLLLAPLSRLWLPEAILRPVIWLVDRPILWVEGMRLSKGQALFQGVLSLFAGIVRNLLVRPLYALVISLFGRRRIFAAVLSERYYADLPERHVQDLLSIDVYQLTVGQCQQMIKLHAWSKAYV